METVESDDVRRLVREYSGAHPGFYRSQLKGRLDEIADAVRFGGGQVSCENGADSDEVAAMLAPHGSAGLKQYLYGD